MLGQSVEIESLHVSHGLCSRKTRNVRNGGARAQVEKNAITGDRSPPSVVQVDLNCPGRYKPGFPSNQIRSSGLEAIEVKLNLTLDHPSFAAQDALHLRRHGPGF